VYGHPNVPTYNYQAAHIFGMIELLSNDQLKTHLEKVVVEFERNRSTPLNLDSLPEEMLQQYRAEVVGFRITSFKTELAFKFSQNRNDQDFSNILKDLEQGTTGQQLLANEMKRWLTTK
jgi:transcriptional regulator